jgi:hypothetical protein
MADQIRATPRNSLAALLSDAINSGVGYMKDPRRTQQLQGLGRLIESTGIPYTVESLSYDPSGRGLFTGAGGLGGTTRMRPQALEAAMTVAPFVGPTARAGTQAAMVAGRAGERLAERVVPQIMERGGMGANILQGLSNRTISPLDVYHGSPHRFPPTERNPLGEFDASKIGTGEGAQAYGYGIYTAEAPAVAKEYQLAEATYKTLQGGLTNKQEFVADMLSQGRPEMSILDLYAQKYGGSFDDAMKDLIDVKEIYKKSGNLYKADLPDAMIPKMLDYDRQLSEQSAEVQKILLPYQKEIGGSFGTGDQTLKAIAFERRMKGLDDSPAAVAQQLKEMGIPGIRYLDEKSRSNFMIQNTYKGKPYGEPVSFITEQQAKDYAKEQIEKGFGIQEIPGTRNFVIFPGEEKSIRILERNGETVANPFYSDPFGNTIPDTTR